MKFPYLPCQQLRMISMFLLTSTVALLLWLIFQFIDECLLRWRLPPGSKLPPTPPASSIRGHVEIIRQDFFHKKCLEWAKEYGPVIRLKINFFDVVVLNDFESVKKLAKTASSLCRSPCFFGYRDGQNGVGIMSGEIWSANRKFCMSLLGASGSAKSSMEHLMTKEFGRLVETIGDANGKPLDVRGYLMECALNNVVSFFYGADLAHDHPTRQEFQRLINRVSVVCASGPQAQFLPMVLRRILTWLPFTRNHRFEEVMVQLDTVNKNQIEEYRRRMWGHETKDFVLGYTEKIEESKHASRPPFTDDYLVGNINGFLLAGTTTTNRMMNWHVVNFARNPDTVQARVQREIDSVIGQERLPTWEDRKQMPYTLACVWEMNRWKATTSLGISRVCAEDVVVGDFFIRKGTTVIPNLRAVHSDPTLWEEPEKFKPERYLGEDGKLLPQKTEHLIPFSVGRRSCPGETFALMELFLLVTIVLQKYRIVPEHPIDQDLDSPGFQLSPSNPIKLCFLPRFPRNAVKT